SQASGRSGQRRARCAHGRHRRHRRADPRPARVSLTRLGGPRGREPRDLLVVAGRGAAIVAPVMASEPLDTLAEIETPEHVRFRRRIAGPARRGLAWIVDSALRLAVLIVLSLALRIGFAFELEDIQGASVGIW